MLKGVYKIRHVKCRMGNVAQIKIQKVQCQIEQSNFGGDGTPYICSTLILLNSPEYS